MQDQGTSGYDTTADTPRVEDRVIERPTAMERPVGYAPTAGIRTGEDELEVKDRVRWGPILAGLVTTIAAMVVFTVLGIALGASVLDRNAPGQEIGTWAAIWGAVSGIVAFFLGGFVAAKSAAVAGPGTGMLNGLMVGFATIALILWLTGAGLGNLFGVLGANIEDITTAIQGTTSVEEAQAQAGEVGNELRATFDQIRDAAWGTLIGLVLPLAAAALGGWIGHNKRRELIEGTG